ncbi:MAG: hypothetical protein OXE99_05645 [Cellvibrionales bacterium]|nr:hypothetical protein [Cellvibrionales bacterium]
MKRIYTILIAVTLTNFAHSEPLSLTLGIAYVLGAMQGALETSYDQTRNYSDAKDTLLYLIKVNTAAGIGTTLGSIALTGSTSGEALIGAGLATCGALSTGAIGLAKILSANRQNAS